ncbi:MAG TPA: hypothetical protein VE990_11255 [Acidimicrobiales bacterium]|nr:hypothetical protein [Acidimicrobiales bacterium]
MRRVLAWAVPGAVTMLLLAGCGGGSAGSAGSGGGSASAQAAIKANWTTFFNGHTPAATKVTLLQNGSNFAAFINAQANSNTAREASAKVDSVTMAGATQADVTYDLLLNGQVGLSGQKGTAVLQGGTWKVSDATFCALAALQNNGKPPTGC